MTRRECGGCSGQGAHRRWCEVVVGPHAAYFGRLAEQAESLGDSVGPNEMGAANQLWGAASLLRAAANQRAKEYAQRAQVQQEDDNEPPAGSEHPA